MIFDKFDTSVQTELWVKSTRAYYCRIIVIYMLIAGIYIYIYICIHTHTCYQLWLKYDYSNITLETLVGLVLYYPRIFVPLQQRGVGKVIIRKRVLISLQLQTCDYKPCAESCDTEVSFRLRLHYLALSDVKI